MNRCRTNQNRSATRSIVNIDGGTHLSAASGTGNGEGIIAGDFIDSTCAGVLRYRAKAWRSGSAGVNGVSAYCCMSAFIASRIGTGDA